MPGWVGPLFLVLAVSTVPWVVHLGSTLPERQVAGHYRAAWIGFDMLLIAALLATGWHAVRGHDHVELPAVACATLLVVDAWFDAMTSPTALRAARAVALALLVELPLAGLCLWIAWHAETVRRERLRLFRWQAATLERDLDLEERRARRWWRRPWRRGAAR